jgi:hypothetical protein
MSESFFLGMLVGIAVLCVGSMILAMRACQRAQETERRIIALLDDDTKDARSTGNFAPLPSWHPREVGPKGE